jgi:hypothetical protein
LILANTDCSYTIPPKIKLIYDPYRPSLGLHFSLTRL